MLNVILEKYKFYYWLAHKENDWTTTLSRQPYHDFDFKKVSCSMCTSRSNKKFMMQKILHDIFNNRLQLALKLYTQN